MMPVPSGWTIIPGLERTDLVVPQGPAAGGVRYHERVRPMLRLGDIVAGIIPAQMVRPEVLSIEELVTYEGEHAAVVSVAGFLENRAIRLAIGVVFGDDFYARLEGVARLESAFEEVEAGVRHMTLHSSLGLGLRRRRYMYRGLPGWQRIARGSITDWFPEDFPRNWALITVLPANPVGTRAETLLPRIIADATSHGFDVRERQEPRPIRLENGLEGLLIEESGLQHGKTALRQVLGLTEGRYVYAAELVSRVAERLDEHRADFAKLWKSFTPCPVPPFPKPDAPPTWTE